MATDGIPPAARPEAAAAALDAGDAVVPGVADGAVADVEDADVGEADVGEAGPPAGWDDAWNVVGDGSRGLLPAPCTGEDAIRVAVATTTAAPRQRTGPHPVAGAGTSEARHRRRDRPRPPAPDSSDMAPSPTT